MTTQTKKSIFNRPEKPYVHPYFGGMVLGIILFLASSSQAMDLAHRAQLPVLTRRSWMLFLPPMWTIIPIS